MTRDAPAVLLQAALAGLNPAETPAGDEPANHLSWLDAKELLAAGDVAIAAPLHDWLAARGACLRLQSPTAPRPR